MFTFRATAAAKAVCPFCKKSTSALKACGDGWLLARGTEQYGPFRWEQLQAMAARGEVSVDDMVKQEGQTQWGLASTYLDLVPTESDPLPDEEPDAAPPDLDIAAIQEKLRALTERFTYTARPEPPAAETSILDMPVADTPLVGAQAEIAPVDDSDPCAEFNVALATMSAAPVARAEAAAHTTPYAEAPQSTEADAQPKVQVDSFVSAAGSEAGLPSVSEVKSSKSRRARPSGFWHSASWLSSTAVLLFALSGLVVSIQNFNERRAATGTSADRGSEEQEEVGTGQERERSAARIDAFLTRLNHCRRQCGLKEVSLSAELSDGCADHARYLARNVSPQEAAPQTVYRQDPANPEFSNAGDKTARVALVNYAEPEHALDRWIGRLFSRAQLLDPSLEQVGVGFAQNSLGAWVCVANPVHGRRDDAPAAGAFLYPAPNQREVPCIGFDRIDEAKGPAVGFPISVIFPRQTIVRDVRATLTDEDGATVDVRVSTPEQPLNAKLQGKTVALHPLRPLQAGHSYGVVLTATVNGVEWQQSWQFTTAHPTGALND